MEFPHTDAFFPSLFSPLRNMQEEVSSLCRQAEDCGLSLSPSDAQQLIAAEEAALQATGRLCLTANLPPKLFAAFSDSLWLDRHACGSVFSELAELFYMYRAEFSLSMTDDRLIAEMRRGFDLCHGELELLGGTFLQQVLRRHQELRSNQRREL